MVKEIQRGLVLPASKCMDGIEDRLHIEFFLIEYLQEHCSQQSLMFAEYRDMKNTKDNVFVTVVASVQYRAILEKAVDAFYTLSNTREQIQAYVFDGRFQNYPY